MTYLGRTRITPKTLGANGMLLSTWRRFVAFALAIVAMAAVVAVNLQRPAEAHHDTACANPDITEAVEDVTGNTPLGFVCHPSLYNGGSWSNTAELKSHVTAVMNSCGEGVANRNLTQAIIEVNGERPYFGSCATTLYQNYVAAVQPGTAVNWNSYKVDTNTHNSAFKTVQITMQACSVGLVTQAIMEQNAAMPKRTTDDGITQPTVGGQDTFISQGQCNIRLYNNGDFYDFNHLRRLVDARDESTHTCANSAITQAYVAMTGWNPLASNKTPDGGDECDAARYGSGSGWSAGDLRNLIYNSWRCRNPQIGQVYASVYSRRANGRGTIGECNDALYGNVVNGRLQSSGWNDTISKVSATQGGLAQQSYSFNANGSLNTPGGLIDVDRILVGTPNGVISTGGGNVISTGGGNVISTGGGNVISTGGGNVISTGGGNIIATDGASIIATDGASLLGANANNLIGQAGGNLTGAR